MYVCVRDTRRQGEIIVHALFVFYRLLKCKSLNTYDSQRPSQSKSLSGIIVKGTNILNFDAQHSITLEMG